MPDMAAIRASQRVSGPELVSYSTVMILYEEAISFEATSAGWERGIAALVSHSAAIGSDSPLDHADITTSGMAHSWVCQVRCSVPFALR